MPVFDEYLDRLDWSEKIYTLREFVNQFTFPQIVIVVDGHYSIKEEETLGNDQILTIHATKTIREAEVAMLSRHRECKTIELNTSLHGAVLRTGMGLINGGMALVKCIRSIKYVRVQYGYYNEKNPESSLSQGDILQLFGVTKSPQTGEELIDSEDSNGKVVRFPVACNAVFAPLRGKDDHMPLLIILKKYPPPCTVLVTSGNNDENFDRSSILPGDIISVNKVTEREVVIATAKYEYKRSIVQIAIDVPATFSVAKNALENEPVYTRVCDVMRNGVDLRKLSNIQNIDFDVMGLFGEEEEPTKGSPPPVPPRGSKSLSSSQEPGHEQVLRHQRALPPIPCSGSEGGQRLRGLGDGGEVELKSEYEEDVFRTDEEGEKEGDSDYEEYHPVTPTSSESEEKQKEIKGNEGSEADYEMIKCESTSEENVYLHPTIHERDSSKDKKDVQSPLQDLSTYPIPLPEVNPSEAEKEEKGGFIPSGKCAVSYQQDIYMQTENDKGTSPPQIKSKPSTRTSLKASIPPPIPRKPKRNKSIDTPISRDSVPTANTTPHQDVPIPSENFHAENDESKQNVSSEEWPSDLRRLSIQDVGDLLKRLNCAHHVKIFEQNLIDGEMLSELEEEHFEELGLSKFQSSKLLKFSKGWRPKY